MGAAPTGSGKTLSYGLPILQWLLEENEKLETKNDDGGGEDLNVNKKCIGNQFGFKEEDRTGIGLTNNNNQSKTKFERLPLQALILVPTRELAMQVTEELKRVCCKTIPIGTIVGGFAEVKQKRVLEKGRPPILVGTPGRLWELVSGCSWCSCFSLGYQ